MPRTFFALWPDLPAREALGGLATRVAAETGGRAIAASNLHLTLVFLGEIARDRVDAARRVAASLRCRSFGFSLDCLGSFRGARVAWAGCSGVPGELGELHASLSRGLAASGFVLEKRAFAPHLTLVRRISRELDLRSVEPVVWKAGSFRLMESLQVERAYRTVDEWPLAGAD
jgi:RNA 2',3'-cyclic 3'-phosphodiesterase